VGQARASPGQVTLIETVVAEARVPRKGPGRPRSKPVRLIYDRAADPIRCGDGSPGTALS